MAAEPQCPDPACKHPQQSGHDDRAGCRTLKMGGAICPCTRTFRGT